MRIAIEARALSASMGIKTYVQQLLSHLPAAASPHEFTVLYDNQKYRGQYRGLHERVVPLRHPWLLGLWMGWQIPRALAAVQPDVVHFTKAAVPATKKVPTVVTIYDIIPILLPESQTPLRRRYWPRTLAHAARESDHIVTISERSKADIVHELGVPDNKVTVTSLAVDTAHFTPPAPAAVAAFRRQRGLLQPYLLFLGTLEPRKNVAGLLRAFAKIQSEVPQQLVVAGKHGFSSADTLRLIAKLGLASRAVLLGAVPQDELPLLYAGADAFVWPSVYEGWGLPPQEAMACGTPVIVSDGGALPEVVGEAGKIVPFSHAKLSLRLDDAEFETRLGQTVAAVLSDASLRMRMREAGLHRVQEFSWKQVARKTMEVYEKVHLEKG